MLLHCQKPSTTSIFPCSFLEEILIFHAGGCLGPRWVKIMNSERQGKSHTHHFQTITLLYLPLLLFFSISYPFTDYNLQNGDRDTRFSFDALPLSSNRLGKCLWISGLCSAPEAQAIPFSIGARVSGCHAHLSWWAVRLTLCSWAMEHLRDICGALGRTT